MSQAHRGLVKGPVRAADGRVLGMIETVIETTAAVRARTALAENEERHRSLVHPMGQGYCELVLLRDAQVRAVDQRYLAFHPAFERLFGIPVAEAVGRTASEVFPAPEPWRHCAFDRIAARGLPERIEPCFVSLGRWFEALVYPTATASGSCTRR